MARTKSRNAARMGGPSRAVSPDPSSAPQQITRRPSQLLHFVAASALLLLLVVVSYSNSLSNGFTWDDHQQIEANSALQPDVPLSRLLFSDVWAFAAQSSLNAPRIYYRPLQMLTYRLVVGLSGLQPRCFHLVSVFFAGLAAILTLGLYWLLTRQLALSFAAAALFAVHPIHSEAIDWASALADLGCTVLLLAAFSLFLLVYSPPNRKTTPPARPRALALWICSTFCFAAALLWKETAAAFPLLVVAYVLVHSTSTPFASRLKHAAVVSLPSWIVLAAYLVLRFRVLGYLAARLHQWNLSPLQFALSAAHLLMEYWWKLLVPLPLAMYRVFSPIRSIWSPAALSALLFVLSAIAVMIDLVRRRPLFAFAALWVFISLFPVLDIYALGRNALAERYLFLPSVGFCLLLGLLAREALQWLPQRFHRAAALSAIVIVLCLSILATRAHNPVWVDDATLFAKSLENAPSASFLHNNVAATQAPGPQGSQVAENHYLQAIALASAENPPDRLQMARACEGLASIYSDRSDFPRALDYLDRVRHIDPSDPEVDGEEGLILTRAGRWDEAAQYLQRAVASHPSENVFNALGLLALQHTHELDQAAAYFSRALAIHSTPDDFSGSLHNNLGVIYGEKERYTDALEEFRLAVSAAPHDPEYRTNLATALAATNQFDDARSQLRAALAIAPNYQPARDLLRQLPPR